MRTSLVLLPFVAAACWLPGTAATAAPAASHVQALRPSEAASGAPGARRHPPMVRDRTKHPAAHDKPSECHGVMRHPGHAMEGASATSDRPMGGPCMAASSAG